MLPAIRHLAGDVFVFQQDSVPVHHARATVEYLSFQSIAFTFSALTSLTERGDNMSNSSQVTIFIFMSLLLQQKDQKTSY